MRAVVIEKPGGPEVLALRDLPDPEPRHQEIRVRVRATAINRADIMQRMGHYPAPSDSPPDIPGLEFAGEVDAVGPGVAGVSLGDRVFGLAGGGTYADFVVVHHAAVAKIPQGMSFVEAASIPEVFITAYDALMCQCGLSPGERVLVHAVGSGVGVAAVQIVAAVGAWSIGTSRTESKVARAAAYGLDQGIVSSDGAFSGEVLRATDGRGVDVILELVGGRYLAEDLKCLRPKGRLIVVGLVGGLRAELDLGVILRQRLTIRGTTLRMRPLEEKIIAARLLENHLVPLFERGALKPVIDKVLPLRDVADAHACLDNNENFGKIVLDLG